MQCTTVRKYIELHEIIHVDAIADTKIASHVKSCKSCQEDILKSASFFSMINEMQEQPEVLPNYSEFSDQVIASISEQNKPDSNTNFNSGIILKGILQTAAALVILFATGSFLQQQFYMKSVQADLQTRYLKTKTTNEYYSKFSNCKENSQEIIKDILLEDKDIAIAFKEASNGFTNTIISKYAKNYCVSLNFALDYKAGKINKQNLQDYLRKVISRIN